jgi:flagellar basal-body rod protein FlgG
MSFSIAMHVANTGIESTSTQMRVTANNLAASGIPGYKKQSVSFSDIGYESIGNTSNSKGLMLGFGTQIDSLSRSFTQGSGKQTNDQYHMMIQGEGFFEILDNNGNKRYTRAGNFTLDNQKNIVMPGTGYKLSNPSITIDSKTEKVTIKEDGKIYGNIAGVESQLGQINLIRFPNNNGLMEMGDNLFMETTSSGTAQQGIPGQNNFGTIMQGWTETSNVNPMEELIQTIEINQVYNNLVDLIKKTDKMMQSGVSLS